MMMKTSTWILSLLVSTHLVNVISGLAMTTSRRQVIGWVGAACAGCLATQESQAAPDAAGVQAKADSTRKSIEAADTKFNKKQDLVQGQVQANEETKIQALDQTGGQAYDEDKIQAKDEAKTKAFAAGGSEAKTVAGADEKVSRAATNTGTKPSFNPSAASSSSGAGVGVVSGSAPGGRIPPKEELNSGVFGFLKKLQGNS